MNDRDKHRYKLWGFWKEPSPTAKPPGGAVEKADAPKKKVVQTPEGPAARQAEELNSIMALYDYRPTIKAQLPATCESAAGAPLDCRTTTIAADSVQLVYASRSRQSVEGLRKLAETLPEGSGVRLHVEELGSLAGVISAKKPGGFHVQIDREYQSAIRDGIARLAASHVIAVDRGAIASSKISDVEPPIKKCQFLDHTGTLREGTLVNISSGDALIRARIIPPERSRIILRGTIQRAADVVRVFEIAFALKFLTPLP